eukprot:12405161-Karenia_brevis.AAC.1
MGLFIQAGLRRESPGSYGCKLFGEGQHAICYKGLHAMALHIIQKQAQWAVLENTDVHDRE